MKELRASLTSLWNGLVLSQRISLIASGLAVVAVLMAIIYLSSKPKMTLLYAGLPTEETAHIVEFLQARKIPYELGDGGGAVLVPGGRVYEIRMALASAGLPKVSDLAGGTGFEILDRQNFGMSDFMQKANYQRALQGELARTIRQMEEIEEARVMIVMPEDRLFRPARQEAKASVFIKLKRSKALSSEKIQSIRFLVANAIQNLQPEHVAIIDNAGRALAEDQQNNSLLSINANQMQIVQGMEESLRTKAQMMLDRVLGPGQSMVQVSTELDFDAVQETAEKFDPDSVVLKDEVNTNEINHTQNQAPGGVAGTTPNLTEQKSSGSTTSSEQTRKTTNNRYEISRTVATRQKATGTIKRLSVAVFVNTRATKTPVAGQTTTPRTPQEIKELENIVKQAVGFAQTADRKDSIQISEVPFADPFADMPAEKMDVASVLAQASNWLPYANQAFLVLLGIGLFLYFRSILKSGDSDNTPQGAFGELMKRFEDMEKKRAEESAFLIQQARIASGDPTVLSPEDLSKIISTQPENTTHAIKKWLSRT